MDAETWNTERDAPAPRRPAKADEAPPRQRCARPAADAARRGARPLCTRRARVRLCACADTRTRRVSKPGLSERGRPRSSHPTEGHHPFGGALGPSTLTQRGAPTLLWGADGSTPRGGVRTPCVAVCGPAPRGRPRARPRATVESFLPSCDRRESPPEGGPPFHSQVKRALSRCAAAFPFWGSAGVFAPISYSEVACVPFGAGFRIRVKLASLDDWEVALLLRGIVDINARCRRCRPRSCSSPARGSRVIFLCRFFPLLGSTLAHPFSITSK